MLFSCLVLSALLQSDPVQVDIDEAILLKGPLSNGLVAVLAYNDDGYYVQMIESTGKKVRRVQIDPKSFLVGFDELDELVVQHNPSLSAYDLEGRERLTFPDVLTSVITKGELSFSKVARNIWSISRGTALGGDRILLKLGESNEIVVDGHLNKEASTVSMVYYWGSDWYIARDFKLEPDPTEIVKVEESSITNLNVSELEKLVGSPGRLWNSAFLGEEALIACYEVEHKTDEPRISVLVRYDIKTASWSILREIESKTDGTFVNNRIVVDFERGYAFVLTTYGRVMIIPLGSPARRA